MAERHIRKLDAKLATVGIDVPASVELPGGTIELEDRLFETLKLGYDDPRRIEFRREVSGHLGRVRRALATEEDEATASGLLDAGRVLRKVLSILDSRDGLGSHRDDEDVKRWLDFVERIRHD